MARTCWATVVAVLVLIPGIAVTQEDVSLRPLGTLRDQAVLQQEWLRERLEEWAKKMPMMVGIIYGLTFQGLALSLLGRHDDAIAASDEAISMLDDTRTDGVEHLFRWRARIMTAAGKHDAARAAEERAAAEVDAKLQKLRDPELRRHFLASRQRAV